MVDYPEIINYSRDELIEEYCKLFDRFQDLKESSEADTQKIYELKRSLDTAIAAQAYLSQELEQYTNSDNNELEDNLHKTQAELVEVKRKYSDLDAAFLNLQHDFNLLSEENAKVTRNLEDCIKNKEQLPCNEDTEICDDYLLRIQTLENENMDLLHKIDHFEEQSVHYTLTIAECEKNMEILRDQVVCLDENLKSKRSDLEEKMQILESTQEQLAEANSQIALLSAASDSHDRKGNSLFAEVDDQRQAMKQLLTTQKRSYMQMKKIYIESESEIRRLKRENISMRTELETCSSIFCNADKIYQEKLNERIRNLINQNEELERKLKWTQEKLKELAAGKGVLFLDSMLNFCKKETDDLKIQLHSVRIQNASLEEQLRNSQQDMARWRFESLKSRCVLIDREYILSENNITFKPANAMDYNITEKDQEEAKPRIYSRRRSSILENMINRKSTSPLKMEINREIECPQNISIKSDEILNNIDIKKEQLNISVNSSTCSSTTVEKTPEKLSPPSEIKEKEVKAVDPGILNTIDLNKSLNMLKIKKEDILENKETSNFNNNVENIVILNKFDKLKYNPPSPMRPTQRSSNQSSPKTSYKTARSILTKENDLIFKDSCKNVRFSSKEDIVHNLIPCSPSPARASASSKPDNTSSTSKTNSKNIVKQSRSKSNIVVRRVVVKSKHD